MTPTPQMTGCMVDHNRLAAALEAYELAAPGTLGQTGQELRDAAMLCGWVRGHSEHIEVWARRRINIYRKVFAA